MVLWVPSESQQMRTVSPGKPGKHGGSSLATVRGVSRLLLLSLVSAMACQGQIGDPRTDDPIVDVPPDEARPGEEFVCRPDEASAGPNLVRRLTVQEYVETVRGALGVDISDMRDALPAEPPSEGFSNVAVSLVVSLDHVRAYESLADTIVDRIDDYEAFLDQYVSCREPSCDAELINNLGQRLFRAPVGDEERAALLPIFAAVRDEGGDFVEGSQYVLRAMLQSPRFLYRSEVEIGNGNERPLNGFEMASRLSYLLWGGPPDDTLFDAAAADALATDDELIAQVDRMLSDPRARTATGTFASEWLHVGNLDFLTRDEARFPDWSPEIRAAMQDETLGFVDRVLFEDESPVGALFDAQYTVVSPELADFYGYPAPDADGVVDLTDIPERGGLLTHGSVLTIGGNESSMVMRGLYLLGTVLCLELDSPPAGVDTTPPPLEAGRSQRFYSEERITNPSCLGCHGQMEPLAFGLERFDATGRHHLEDEYGNALQQDGFVRFGPATDPVPYESIGELSSLLGSHERVRDCFSLKAAQFAMGRRLLSSDGCALQDLRDRLSTTDGTYRDLVIALVTSSMFRNIQTEEAP